VELGTGALPILKQFIQDTLIPIVNNMTAWIEKMGGLSGIIDTVKSKVAEWAANNEELVAVIQGVWDIIKNLGGFLINVFTGDWAGAWENIKNIAISAWDVITNAVKWAWEAIKGIFTATGLVDAAKGAWQAVVDFFTVAVPEWGRNVVQWMKDGLSSAWHTVIDWFRNAWASIVNALTSWMPGFLKKWLGIGEDSGKEYAAGLDAAEAEVDAAAGGLVDSAVEAVAMKEEEVKAAGEAMGKSLSGGLAAGIDAGAPDVVGSISGVNKAMDETFGSFWETQSPSKRMERYGKMLIQGLQDGIKALEPILLGSVSNLAGEVVNDFDVTLGKLPALTGETFIDIVKEVITGGMSLKSAVDGVLDRVINAVFQSGLDSAVSWARGKLASFGSAALALVPLTIGMSSAVADWVSDAGRWIDEHIMGNEPGYINYDAPGMPGYVAPAASSTTNQDFKGMFDGATFVVRDETDIDAIAAALYDKWRADQAGVGVMA